MQIKKQKKQTYHVTPACEAKMFLAHLSQRLMVSYCDHSPSFVIVIVAIVRLSVHRQQSLNNISS